MTKDDTKIKEEKEDDVCKEDKKTEELRQKAEDFENKYKRALADYQNLEKRSKEERLDWIGSANKQLILRLLPVLDTLELASKHVEDEGLKLSIAQFLDILKQEGVVRIETIGKEFNPHLMEAIGTGEGEEGKVLEELRAGYMMNEHVLRPAQVIVGKATS